MGAAEETLVGAIVAHGEWSDNARRLAHLAIADTLAVGLGGMRQEQVALARSTLLPNPSALAVPTWSGDERYALADAAFIGGVACHSLDWDDYMHPMHGHCSAVLLPVVWTISERARLSGAQLLDGFLAGYQVDYLASIAFGNAHYARGWHATSTVGTLGAAAAAARLFGLNRQQTGHALAIAASFASGIRANFGTATKALHAGAAARHGVQAAQLAGAGAAGSRDWLTGAHGMLGAFGSELSPEAAHDTIQQTAGAAHGIESGWGLVQKPYCCCGSCHSAVEAVIGLVTDHEVSGHDITEIRLHVDPLIPAIMQVDEPGDQYSARYSPTWVMAVAAFDRAAAPAQFSAHALGRREVQLLRDRVRVFTDLQTTDHDRFAGMVEIDVAGTTLRREIRHPSGHPERPMLAAQRALKQREALSGAVSATVVSAVEQVLADIPTAPNVAELGVQIRAALDECH